MNIIFGRHNADLLRERHIILDLETLDADGQALECFCLVDGAAIPTNELASLRHSVRLHDKLVENLRKKNYAVCAELIEHLRGRFGGELDSFYDHVIERSKPTV